jgi:hypothetical protein
MTQTPCINIPLPNGGKIQTFGLHYQAGAAIHILDSQGEMQLRLLACQIQEKPQESITSFLKTLGKGCINLAGDQPNEFCYEIMPGLLLSSNSQDLSITQRITEEESKEQDENQGDEAYSENGSGNAVALEENPDDELKESLREVIYYNMEEWAENPEEVMGAFLIALHKEVEAASAAPN